MNHPLFNGFVNSCIVKAGSALGFDVCVVSSLEPLYPLTDQSRLCIRKSLDLHGGPAGFYRVAQFKAPGLYCAAYAKPLTALAMTCYLAGLGEVAQKQHQAKPARYRYSHADSGGLKGWSERRSLVAEQGERDARDHGQATYKTHEVATPLVSWLYSGASVLEDVRLAAYAAVGDEADELFQLDTEQLGLFVEAQALLLDGFAWHTDSTPSFTVIQGRAHDHHVSPSSIGG
jgi:hypothetical protein